MPTHSDTTNRKVIALVRGGLGNQLFCYAAARRLALVSSAELVLDTTSGFERDPYGRSYALDAFAIAGRPATASERLAPFGRVRRRLLREWSYRRPFGRTAYVAERALAYEPRLMTLVPRQTRYLDGYWQSERYFADVADTIREDLGMQPPREPEALDMAKRIACSNAVAVHVRWFGAPGDASGANVPESYYRAAIEKLSVDAPEYFVFSENADAAQAMLRFLPKRVTFVRQRWRRDWVDLWLMRACRHFVIGNSTFGWWSAWLGAAPDKVVVAPARVSGGEGAWGFPGLIPASWRLA